MTPDELHAIVTQDDMQFRLWLPEPPCFDQPVGFDLPTDNLSDRCAQCIAFNAFIRGRAPRCPVPPQDKRRKLISGLRAIDAWRAQAGYRAIALALFGKQAVAQEYWKTSSLRQRIIRLVRWTQKLIDGGYTKLLGFIGLYAQSALLAVEECKPFVG